MNVIDYPVESHWDEQPDHDDDTTHVSDLALDGILEVFEFVYLSLKLSDV